MSEFHTRNIEAQYSAFVKARKFCIQGKWENGGASKLSFEVDGGRVIALMWINHPDDTANRGPLRLGMDMDHWCGFMTLLKQARHFKNGEYQRLENFTGNPKSLQTQSMLAVGRNNDGYLFITLYSKDRPQVNIPIIPTQYCKFVSADGQYNQPGPMLDAFVETFFDVANTVLVDGMVHTFHTVDERKAKNQKEFSERQKKNNGGSGGYGNNNNSSYNNNNGGGGGNQSYGGQSEDQLMM